MYLGRNTFSNVRNTEPYFRHPKRGKEEEEMKLDPEFSGDF